MPNSNVTPEPEFNPDHIQALLQEMELKLQEGSNSNNKDVVVFVGPTGSGKSTLLCYLMDLVLTVKSNAISTVEYELNNPENRRAPKIGHRGSETLHPSLYESGKLYFEQLALLDTAGFGDSRGDTKELCVSLALKNMFKKSQSKIKSLVVVLKYPDIEDPRGTQVRDTLKLLSQLTEELDGQQLTFCATGVFPSEQSDQDIKKILHEKIKTLIETIQREVRDDETLKDDEKEQRKKIIKGLQAITIENLFIAHKLYEKEKQKQFIVDFFKHIQNLPGLTKPLRVPMTDAIRLKLVKWNTDFADRTVPLLQKKIEINEAIADLNGKIKTAKNLLEKLHRNHQISKRITGELSQVEKDKNSAVANRDQLIQTGQEVVISLDEYSIPAPKLDSGISHVGFCKTEELTVLPGFFSITIPADSGMKVLRENKHNGKITVSIDRKIPAQDHPVVIPIEIKYLCSALPKHQDDIKMAETRLQEIEKKLTDAQADKKKNELELTALKKEIARLDVSHDGTIQEVAKQLSKYIVDTFTKIEETTRENVINESQLAPMEPEFAFRQELIELAELTEDKLRDFIGQYCDYLKLKFEQSAQESNSFVDMPAMMRHCFFAGKPVLLVANTTPVPPVDGAAAAASASI